MGTRSGYSTISRVRKGLNGTRVGCGTMSRARKGRTGTKSGYGTISLVSKTMAVQEVGIQYSFTCK